MASFLDDLKKQATADAEAGAKQSDVQVFLKTLDKIVRNPSATVQQLKGSMEATTFKGAFVRGMREVNRSAARLLVTPIPR